MVKAHYFLMPDYYPTFRCKMGDCRHACCEGWRVSLSLDDYFKLEAEECSSELREKIDRGVKVSLQPTPDAYAYIQHDYFGNCPLRLKDGRCALHAEMGENALAQVCKLYPRGIRKYPNYECSCANSCEAVIEHLIKKEAPIEFIKKEQELDIPTAPRRKVNFFTEGREESIRLWLIGILQNRRLGLSKRLLGLGFALKKLEDCLHNKDLNGLDTLLKAPFEPELPKFEVGRQHIEFGIEIMEQLLSFIDKKSDSVREYGEQALAYFGDNDDVISKYNNAQRRFEQNFPKWEIWFEHLLVNHMFFEQFPFQDRPLGLWEEYVGISAVYSLLRFLAIGYMANHNGEESFVDMVSAVFRLVDHTDFDLFAAELLKDLNCNTPQKIFDLIVL